MVRKFQRAVEAAPEATRAMRRCCLGLNCGLGGCAARPIRLLLRQFWFQVLPWPIPQLAVSHSIVAYDIAFSLISCWAAHRTWIRLWMRRGVRANGRRPRPTDRRSSHSPNASIAARSRQVIFTLEGNNQPVGARSASGRPDYFHGTIVGVAPRPVAPPAADQSAA